MTAKIKAWLLLNSNNLPEELIFTMFWTPAFAFCCWHQNTVLQTGYICFIFSGLTHSSIWPFTSDQKCYYQHLCYTCKGWRKWHCEHFMWIYICPNWRKCWNLLVWPREAFGPSWFHMKHYPLQLVFSKASCRIKKWSQLPVTKYYVWKFGSYASFFSLVFIIYQDLYSVSRHRQKSLERSELPLLVLICI